MRLMILILLRAIDLYSYVLLAYVVLSWIPSLFDTAFGRLIVSMVRPVVAPFRKLNLQFFGLDWTVFVIFILLNIVTRFLQQLFYIF